MLELQNVQSRENAVALNTAAGQVGKKRNTIRGQEKLTTTMKKLNI